MQAGSRAASRWYSAAVVMVMLHGGTWLVARADEAVAARSARLVQPLGLLTLGLFALGMRRGPRAA